MKKKQLCQNFPTKLQRILGLSANKRWTQHHFKCMKFIQYNSDGETILVETSKFSSKRFERFVSHSLAIEFVHHRVTPNHALRCMTHAMTVGMKTQQERRCYGSIGLCSQSLINHGRVQECVTIRCAFSYFIRHLFCLHSFEISLIFAFCINVTISVGLRLEKKVNNKQRSV